ncbi:MAG: hypothetical protein P0116_02745 [Candidatus Nitrosocosmicus sp.]|nr:hypothetical protein [Candidatus Nitrosocosmicus sp.]
MLRWRKKKIKYELGGWLINSILFHLEILWTKYISHWISELDKENHAKDIIVQHA